MSATGALTAAVDSSMGDNVRVRLCVVLPFCARPLVPVEVKPGEGRTGQNYSCESARCSPKAHVRKMGDGQGRSRSHGARRMRRSARAGVITFRGPALPERAAASSTSPAGRGRRGRPRAHRRGTEHFGQPSWTHGWGRSALSAGPPGARRAGSSVRVSSASWPVSRGRMSFALVGVGHWVFLQKARLRPSPSV